MHLKIQHHKIQRQDSVESLTTLEEGEFMLAIDGCIRNKQKYKYDNHMQIMVMNINDVTTWRKKGWAN